MHDKLVEFGEILIHEDNQIFKILDEGLILFLQQ